MYPSRALIHANPRSPTAATVARSPLSFSAGARNRSDRFSRTGSAATYRPNTRQTRLANSTRSSNCAAAATAAALGPKATPARPTAPPRTGSPHPSMSNVRHARLSRTAPSTNHGACVPAAAAVTPAMKNGATPTSGMASAAALHDEANLMSGLARWTTVTPRRRTGSEKDRITRERPGAAIGRSRPNVRRSEGDCHAAGRPATDAACGSSEEDKARIRRGPAYRSHR